MPISTMTIKKRWETIFNRIEAKSHNQREARK